MFDIQQQVFHENGERDDVLVERYLNGLMKEFAQSIEAQPIIEKYGEVGWVDTMMYYAIHHLGETAATMSPSDFEEIVFQLFPEKVSTPADSAPAIIDELRAFWNFVSRQYNLNNALAILKSLDDNAAETLRKELANPRNYGMAKSFVMAGEQAGFDMRTEEGSQAFMGAYNATVAARNFEQLPPPPPFGVPDIMDLPLVHPMSGEERRKKRQQKKAQRQARKRNRR